MRDLQPGFPNFDTTSPYLPMVGLSGVYRAISHRKSILRIDFLKTNPLFGGACIGAPMVHPFINQHYVGV